MTDTQLGELAHRGVPYRRAGRSGLLLPAFALGLWHSFGETRERRAQADLIVGAFDRGITHFDNANRYGPPHGHAERVLGDVLGRELRAHRDEITISTKAGNQIAAHPYGSGASRKHLLDQIDRSLERLGVEHVDVFYSHRHDPATPLEETAQALADIARQGKARYIGLSNYPPEAIAAIAPLLGEAGAPVALVQPRYSLLDRTIEREGHVLDLAETHGFGVVVYSPLAQGLLTDRYLDGAIPDDARAGRSEFLGTDFLTDDYLRRTRALAGLAESEGATTPQLALRWILREQAVTSVLLGVSKPEQLDANLASARIPQLGDALLAQLDELYPDTRED
ncbi:aldo/keto reductase [Leucobacter celer]|jgi:L-glyceraldehyde 3-phosphate reductase|uniref:aldo/keto reductase n=1 Tax=Leucobacter celer TaxID=668625 RepID=UPI0006A788F4|nr:aldo/keto reductase [Leucobacter celer]